jgi:hypothetical protein
MDFFARVARSGWILFVVNGLLQAGAMPCLAGVVVSENIAPGATSIDFGNISARAINGHPGSRTTSFIVASNAVAASSLPAAGKTQHWRAMTDAIDLTLFNL